MVATLLERSYSPTLGATWLFALDQTVQIGGQGVNYALLASTTNAQGEMETTVYPADAQGQPLGNRAFTLTRKRDMRQLLQALGLEVRGIGGVVINLASLVR